jgi:hypothetical protein
MKNTRTLAQIVQKIKALEKSNAGFEKRTIGQVIEIGGLLEEASESGLILHGEYMDWIEKEFPSWTHQTSLNYRSVYKLTQKSKRLDFTKLNISLNALYFVASLRDDGKVSGCDDTKARDTILKAATQRRVTFTMAKGMAKFASPPPTPQSVEPLDDEVVTAEMDAGPEPDDEAGPIEPLDEEISDEPPNELATALDKILTRYSNPQDPAWQNAVDSKSISNKKLIKITLIFAEVSSMYFSRDKVKATADRTEAAADANAMLAKTLAKKPT